MTPSDTEAGDADLVRRTRAGSTAAYGVLVQRHLKAVYGTALRIVCDPAAADDVAQDTFVRAFQRLHMYDPRHPFRSWLLKIATNLSLNQLRSRRREHLLHQRFGEAGRPDPADSSDLPGPGEWERWLSQIDASQRAAIVLFHFEGMPYAEIARILGVPLNTVRTLLHRGRRRLREVMTGSGMPENGSCNATIPTG